MGKRRRPSRWGMPEDRREPWVARVSLLVLLVNVFVWVGFRNVDVLVVSLGSTFLAFIGTLLGLAARRKLRRHGGRVAGEAMAMIGYWGNLMFFLGTLLLFCYSVAMAVLRGELL